MSRGPVVSASFGEGRRQTAGVGVKRSRIFGPGHFRLGAALPPARGMRRDSRDGQACRQERTVSSSSF